MMEVEENPLFGFTLMTGDCLEGLRAVPSRSVDTVLTDPPFSSGGREATKGVRKSMNRGVEAEDWFGSDNMTVAGFQYLMRECAQEWYRITKPGGHIFVFIDWRMVSHLASAVESADLLLRGTLVWNKTYFGMGNFFRNQHEFILHFSNGKPREASRKDVANVLSFKPKRNGDHPTQKPVPLLRELLSVVGRPGDRVLDSFNGSGATGVAALLSGMKYTGIEREPRYVDITRERLLSFPSEAET